MGCAQKPSHEASKRPDKGSLRAHRLQLDQEALNLKLVSCEYALVVFLSDVEQHGDVRNCLWLAWLN